MVALKKKSITKVFGFILWIPQKSVQRFGPIHHINVVIFHWKNETFDLLVALEEKSDITQVSRIHPLATMNVCTKGHVNPFSSC